MIVFIHIIIFKAQIMHFVDTDAPYSRDSIPPKSVILYAKIRKIGSNIRTLSSDIEYALYNIYLTITADKRKELAEFHYH